MFRFGPTEGLGFGLLNSYTLDVQLQSLLRTAGVGTLSSCPSVLSGDYCFEHRASSSFSADLIHCSCPYFIAQHEQAEEFLL